MLIGVDAVAFTGAAAGVVRYLRETLAEMMALVPNGEFILYAPVPVDAGLPEGNWRVRYPSAGRRSRPGRWLRDLLPRMLADDRVDVYWGQNQMIPRSGPRACRRVLTVHDLAGLLFPATMRFGHRLSWRVNFRTAVQAADRIVAVSKTTARLLDLNLGAGGKTSVVYPGCAAGLGPVADASTRDAVLRKFGLPRDYLLTVGTLEPRKNHLTLLRALSRLNVGLPLVVVGGSGWRCAAILAEIRRQQVRGRVLPVGRVTDEDLRALYSAAKLMVYPSIYEGFGSPVLEAMACGCPVLCSWSSSLPEVGGRAARYFLPRDAAGLASRLAELSGDERQLAEMRAEGFRQAARFSYKATATRMLAVLRGQGTRDQG